MLAQPWNAGCQLVHMGSRTARYSAANGRRLRLPAVVAGTTYPWGGFADVVNHHSELVGDISLEMVVGSFGDLAFVRSFVDRSVFISLFPLFFVSLF